MAKVKLSLRSKTDSDLREFAETHQAEMLNNPNFPAPDPTLEAFTSALGDYSYQLDEVSTSHATYLSKVVEKNNAREVLMDALTKRGNYVENASNGDAEKIRSAGFEIRHENRSPTDLAAPLYLRAVLGDHHGEINLIWEPVKGAKTYIIELRSDDDDAAWQQAQFTTRSRAILPGLRNARTYSFRVKAIGAKGESEWSDEASKMVG